MWNCLASLELLFLRAAFICVVSWRVQSPSFLVITPLYCRPSRTLFIYFFSLLRLVTPVQPWTPDLLASTSYVLGLQTYTTCLHLVGIVLLRTKTYSVPCQILNNCLDSTIFNSWNIYLAHPKCWVQKEITYLVLDPAPCWGERKLIKSQGTEKLVQSRGIYSSWTLENEVSPGQRNKGFG